MYLASTHSTLLAEFPSLKPHKILGKWLYIAPSHPEFESTATTIISLALQRDGRLGVDSSASRARRRR